MCETVAPTHVELLSSGYDDESPLVEALAAFSVSGVPGHSVDDVEAAKKTVLDRMRQFHIYDEIPSDSTVGKTGSSAVGSRNY